MITIGQPFVDFKGEEAFLCAKLIDDQRENPFVLWFSVDRSYGEYLCDDRADAFMLVALMNAMKSHQDIRIMSPVSRRLLFNINNTLQPLFSKMIPNSCCINIMAEGGYCSELNGTAVGCGCSLGVDSLSALYKHMGNDVVEGYRVTHLALFNSGQIGYLDAEKDEQAFRQAVRDIIPFSEETHLPIVAIDTNMNELFVSYGFNTAVSRFLISTISCPLALQKLFGKYVFASSYSVEDFEVSKKDQSHAEAVIIPLLSTESTEIILSNAVMTRVEKTEFIKNNPLTSRYLDVCWAVQLASSVTHQDKYLKEKTKKNCGWCDKCLRTLFTLELLGVDIEDYEEIFDLSKYYAHKEEFVKTVLLKQKSNIMYREIVALMHKNGYQIPKRIQRSVEKDRIKIFIHKLLSR